MKLQFVVLSLVISAAAAAVSVKVTGAWNPISNLKDPHALEVAEFAVSDYNKQSKHNLKFVSIEKGDSQTVEGTNYRLLLVVEDGAAESKYDAVVWEVQPGNYKELISFNPHH